jgi:serine/threonine protein phosphatase PrpC
MPLGLGLELEFNRGPELGREKADIGDKSKFLSSVQINLWTRYLQIGDSLLLCSDGLWGEMDENEIVQHLQELSSPERVIKRLIDTANTNGGHDNIAVAICQMVSN